MTIAIVVYVAASGTSPSSMKGLLVSSSQLSTDGRVSVNDTTIEPDALRRLASRAAQIAVQKNEVPASASSSSSSVSDRSAWIAMRQTRRDLASVYDLAKNAAAPIVPPADVASAQPVLSAPTPEARPALPVSSGEKSLPDSGPMIHVSLCIAFGLACLRKRTAIAALIRAS